MKAKKTHYTSYLILAIFGLYMLFPFVSTFFYATSTKWSNTILPNDFTFKWFIQLIEDPNFVAAVIRSFALTFTSLAVVLVVMVPTVFLVYTSFPKVDQFMKGLVLMPYAIPGVILATGLLRMYSGTVIPMYLVLVGALFIGSLPFMYQGIRNSLESIQTKKLIDAAEILGATRFTSFIRIILPNIRLGLLITTLLIFSGFFGEFVLTNLLIGGRYETIRIYMLRRMNENGHLASSIMVAYFLLLMGISLVITYLTSPDRRGPKKAKRHQIPGNRISLAESVSILKIGVKKEKRQRI